MIEIHIPHASEWWVAVEPPNKILHVVSTLSRLVGSPGFDARAKYTLEKAAAAAQADIDAGCFAVVHYSDDTNAQGRPKRPTDETPVDDDSDPAARALDAKRGLARAAKMTRERREIARAAARKRWSKP